MRTWVKIAEWEDTGDYIWDPIVSYYPVTNEIMITEGYSTEANMPCYGVSPNGLVVTTYTLDTSRVDNMDPDLSFMDESGNFYGSMQWTRGRSWPYGEEYGKDDCDDFILRPTWNRWEAYGGKLYPRNSMSRIYKYPLNSANVMLARSCDGTGINGGPRLINYDWKYCCIGEPPCPCTGGTVVELDVNTSICSLWPIRWKDKIMAVNRQLSDGKTVPGIMYGNVCDWGYCYLYGDWAITENEDTCGSIVLMRNLSGGNFTETFSMPQVDAEVPFQYEGSAEGFSAGDTFFVRLVWREQPWGGGGGSGEITVQRRIYYTADGTTWVYLESPTGSHWWPDFYANGFMWRFYGESLYRKLPLDSFEPASWELYCTYPAPWYDPISNTEYNSFGELPMALLFDYSNSVGIYLGENYEGQITPDDYLELAMPICTPHGEYVVLKTYPYDPPYIAKISVYKGEPIFVPALPIGLDIDMSDDTLYISLNLDSGVPTVAAIPKAELVDGCFNDHRVYTGSGGKAVPVTIGYEDVLLYGRMSSDVHLVNLQGGGGSWETTNILEGTFFSDDLVVGLTQEGFSDVYRFAVTTAGEGKIYDYDRTLDTGKEIKTIGIELLTSYYFPDRTLVGASGIIAAPIRYFDGVANWAEATGLPEVSITCIDSYED